MGNRCYANENMARTDQCMDGHKLKEHRPTKYKEQTWTKNQKFIKSGNICISWESMAQTDQGTSGHKLKEKEELTIGNTWEPRTKNL